MLLVISISTCLITTLVAVCNESDTEVVEMRFSLLYYIVISVQFSHSVVSDSWRPHGLQQTRLPCPSPTPRVCSYSCPLSRWWLRRMKILLTLNPRWVACHSLHPNFMFTYILVACHSLHPNFVFAYIFYITYIYLLSYLYLPNIYL